MDLVLSRGRGRGEEGRKIGRREREVGILVFEE